MGVIGLDTFEISSTEVGKRKNRKINQAFFINGIPFNYGERPATEGSTTQYDQDLQKRFFSGENLKCSYVFKADFFEEEKIIQLDVHYVDGFVYITKIE